MGANKAKPVRVSRKLVSIHAPVMGANQADGQCLTHQGFNPRTRDGCEVLPAYIER